MKEWKIAPPINLTDGLGIGDGTIPTPRTQEIDERIKKTHFDCECCRNWARIVELKETQAHQAGVRDADGYKRGRQAGRDEAVEIAINFFAKIAIDIDIQEGLLKALQDNK